MLAGVTGVALASAPTVSAPAPVSTLPVATSALSSVTALLSLTATGLESVMVMSRLSGVLLPRLSVTMTGMASTTGPLLFCTFGS